jgi:hypothetical protein
MYLLFGKNRANSIQLEVDTTHLSKPYEVAESFAKLFEIVFNKSH